MDRKGIMYINIYPIYLNDLCFASNQKKQKNHSTQYNHVYKMTQASKEFIMFERIIIA